MKTKCLTWLTVSSLFKKSVLQVVQIRVEEHLLRQDEVQDVNLHRVEQLKELLQLVEELRQHEVEDSNMRASALFIIDF